ncbi:MAG: hypothetical protein KF768_05480 [Phycisphaeraceae bacterium]|nr:hypothetical protein [Phycisphaeraceae bacterium]
MEPISLILVALYVILIIIIGVIPGRIRGDEAFLISARRLQGWSSGFSIAASKIGGGLLVTYSALVFAYGWEAIWLFVGYIFGYSVYYAFSRRLHAESKEHNYYTMADYYQKHYGRSVGVWIGAVAGLSLFGWILTNLMAGGKMVASLTGIPDIAASAAMAGTIAIYLAAGGFHAVVRTDLIQYIAVVVLACVVAVALRSAPPTTVSDVVHSTAHESMSVGRIASFFLAGLFFPMGSAELWQRTYATETKRGLLVSIAIASLSFVVVGVIMTVVCLTLRGPGGGIDERQAELALTEGVTSRVGPVLAGLWVIAFASAIMSSADTFMFTTVSAFVEDVLEREELIHRSQRVVFMRVGCVLVAFLGLGCLVFFPGVVAITFYFVGITMSLGTIGFAAWAFGSRIPHYWLPVAAGLGIGTSTLHAVVAGVTPGTALLNIGATTFILIIGIVDGLRLARK